MRIAILALATVTSTAGCGPSGRGEPIRIAAAISLTESLEQATRTWELQHPGERAVVTFAASNVLARQIEEGALADLFISADAVQMERLVVGRLVVPDSVVSLLSNQLAVVTPHDRPLPSPPPAGLADERVKRLALGDPAGVPAGVYARQWLQDIQLWPRIESKVVPTASVRAALAAVESGNADAAVVYRTDVRAATRVRLELVVPREQGPDISYPAGVVAASRQADRARALLTWLRGEDARRIFTDAGFGVPAPLSAQ